MKNRKKILIADDDPAIIEATRLLLEECGYDVVTTGDGKTICDMAQNLPDLLLLDIWMSGQDGRELCRKIKTSGVTKHIPIILISANRDIQRSVKASGADDFLAKPYNLTDLLEKIEYHTQSA